MFVSRSHVLSKVSCFVSVSTTRGVVSTGATGKERPRSLVPWDCRKIYGGGPPKMVVHTFGSPGFTHSNPRHQRRTGPNGHVSQGKNPMSIPGAPISHVKKPGGCPCKAIPGSNRRFSGVASHQEVFSIRSVPAHCFASMGIQQENQRLKPAAT